MMQNFWAIKIYLWNYTAGIRGNWYQSSDCFEYSKTSVLKIMKLSKKILAKIFQPKKSQNRKFQTPKFLQSSLSLEIWSTPLGFQRSAPVQGFLWKTLQVVADSDLQIRWGRGYPDPEEISGGPGLKWYIQNWIRHHYWERPGLQELRLQWYYGVISKYAKIRLPSIIKSILCLRQNTSPLIHFLPAKMKCELWSQNYYSLTVEQKEKSSKSHRLSQPQKHPAILRYFFM